MPPLVRFMLRHAAIGFALGVVVAIIIVATDALHLRSLAMATQMGWLGLGVFCFLTGLTIGSLQIGFAVMLQGNNDDHKPGGGHGARLAPIPARIDRRR
jgi:hypothetical protein